MKKTLFSILSLILLISCSQKHPNTGASFVSFAKGTSTIIRGLDRYPATQHFSLKESDIISTGTDGEVRFILSGKGLCVIKNSTTMTLTAGITSSKNDKIYLSLRQGKIILLLRKMLKDEKGLSVSTPVAVVGVRGTSFLVDTSDNKSTISVLEGSILLSEKTNNEKAFLVDADKTAKIEGGHFESLSLVDLTAEVKEEIRLQSELEDIEKHNLLDIRNNIKTHEVQKKQLITFTHLSEFLTGKSGKDTIWQFKGKDAELGSYELRTEDTSFTIAGSTQDKEWRGYSIASKPFWINNNSLKSDLIEAKVIIKGHASGMFNLTFENTTYGGDNYRRGTVSYSKGTVIMNEFKGTQYIFRNQKSFPKEKEMDNHELTLVYRISTKTCYGFVDGILINSFPLELGDKSYVVLQAGAMEPSSVTFIIKDFSIKGVSAEDFIN